MRKIFITGLAMVLAWAGAAAAAQPAGAPSIYGVWLNHAGNVKVETKPCGQQLCGTIVWASPEALQKARAAGTDQLVGLQLLSGYRQKPNGEWEGKVFVPDLQRTFASRIYRLSADKIRISGCLLGVICKYQTWTRQ